MLFQNQFCPITIASIALAYLLAFGGVSGALAQKEESVICAPQLTGPFAEAVTEAGESGNFQTLRVQFGPDLVQLVGLPCTAERLAQILTDAGWRKVQFAARTRTGSDTVVVAFLQDRSLWGYLRGRDSGKAVISLLDNTTVHFSIGVLK